MAGDQRTVYCICIHSHTGGCGCKYCIWVFFYVPIFQSSEKQSGIRQLCLIVFCVAVHVAHNDFFTLKPCIGSTAQKELVTISTCTGAFTHLRWQIFMQMCARANACTHTTDQYFNIHSMSVWMPVQQVVSHSCVRV